MTIKVRSLPRLAGTELLLTFWPQQAMMELS